MKDYLEEIIGGRGGSGSGPVSSPSLAACTRAPSHTQQLPPS